MDDVQRRWDAYWGRAPADGRDAAWLSPWLQGLGDAPGPLLEVGCGGGVDTGALARACGEVIVLDYSASALARVGRRVPGVARVLCDLRDGLPFADGSLGAVVASLSLHYFDAKQTRAIVGELWRCLREGGLLLARVNSTRDVHYGAEGHAQLEHHFYEVRGRSKRFFDRADVERFFGAGFTLERIEEVSIGIEPEKHAWLVAAIIPRRSPAR